MFVKDEKVSVGMSLFEQDKKNKYLFISLKDLKNSNSYAKIREGCFWKYCYWRSQATLNALDKIFQVLENADRLIEQNSELTQSFKKRIKKQMNNDIAFYA